MPDKLPEQELVLRRSGFKVFRKRLENNLARFRGDFLVRVAAVFRQLASQHAVSFFGWRFSRRAFDRPLESIRDGMHGLGRETQLGALKTSDLEKLIEKCAAVAVGIPIAGNEPVK